MNLTTDCDVYRLLEPGIGGLICENKENSTIKKSYSHVDINFNKLLNTNGYLMVGGLVGNNSKDLNIEECYAIGKIRNEGIQYAYCQFGGLIGSNSGSTSILNAYSNVQIEDLINERQAICGYGGIIRKFRSTEIVMEQLI